MGTIYTKFRRVRRTVLRKIGTTRRWPCIRKRGFKGIQNIMMLKLTCMLLCSFMVIGHLTFWVDFCMWCRAGGCPVFWAPLVEETVLSPLCIPGSSVICNWPHVHGCICGLYSVSLLLFHFTKSLYLKVIKKYIRASKDRKWNSGAQGARSALSLDVYETWAAHWTSRPGI